MNGFYLVGKITSEPEKGETINGTKLCRLRISVDKSVKDQGENFEIFEVTLFRGLAETDYEIGQSLSVESLQPAITRKTAISITTSVWLAITSPLSPDTKSC